MANATPTAGTTKRGRPRGSTREQILAVALDLFTEQGYDKTSLREIAEKLGFTKAALYYHFERKEDILLALHLQVHELGHDVMRKMTNLDGPEIVRAWPGLLNEFIDQVMANRKLFLFHARNHEAVGNIENDKHNADDHEDMEYQLRRVLGDTSISKSLRVRMACSIGAIIGTVFGGTEVFADIPSHDFADLLRDAAHDLLHPTEPEGTRARRKANSTKDQSS